MTETPQHSKFVPSHAYSRSADSEKKVLSLRTSRHVINTISNAETIPNLLNETMTALGAKLASYHHVAGVGAYEHANMSRFYSFNLPQPLEDYFHRNALVKDDQGFRASFKKCAPIWLSTMQSHETVVGTKTEILVREGLKLTGDGLLLPLMGPSDRKGYAFVCFGLDPSDVDELFEWQIHTLIQKMHIRYCFLLDNIRKRVNLTRRESEVLELISYGKSNPEIAQILNIKTNTVSGYVKTLFLKLETSDRVTTTMRARALNLLL